MFQTKAVDNVRTHFVFSNFFFLRKSCRLWDNVELYSRAGQAPDNSIAHAHIMLDDKGCRHTVTICNTNCFSTPKMAARTRLIVMFIRSLRAVLFVLITVSPAPLAVFSRVLCFCDNSPSECRLVRWSLCLLTCCFTFFSRFALNCKLTV
jgi:hypothetical protein